LGEHVVKRKNSPIGVVARRRRRVPLKAVERGAVFASVAVSVSVGPVSRKLAVQLWVVTERTADAEPPPKER